MPQQYWRQALHGHLSLTDEEHNLDAAHSDTKTRQGRNSNSFCLNYELIL